MPPPQERERPSMLKMLLWPDSWFEEQARRNSYKGNKGPHVMVRSPSRHVMPDRSRSADDLQLVDPATGLRQVYRPTGMGQVAQVLPTQKPKKQKGKAQEKVQDQLLIGVYDPNAQVQQPKHDAGRAAEQTDTANEDAILMQMIADGKNLDEARAANPFGWSNKQFNKRWNKAQKKYKDLHPDFQLAAATAKRDNKPAGASNQQQGPRPDDPPGALGALGTLAALTGAATRTTPDVTLTREESALLARIAKEEVYATGLRITSRFHRESRRRGQAIGAEDLLEIMTGNPNLSFDDLPKNDPNIRKQLNDRSAQELGRKK